MSPLLGWGQSGAYTMAAKTKATTTVKKAPASKPAVTYVDETDDYNYMPSTSGAVRDVDEYNRRGNYGSDYSKQPMYDDSVTISRQEYEDFAYSRQMERFDDYNGRFTLIVNDPWYYDLWYSPYYGSYYWGTSWYYPWYSSYSWYDPWYRPSYWGWGYRYHTGWYGYYGPYRYGYLWGRPYHHGRYYGYTGYRRGGYVNGRPVNGRGGRYGYGSGSVSTGRGTATRRGSVQRNNTVRRGNSFGGNSSGSSSSDSYTAYRQRNPRR